MQSIYKKAYKIKLTEIKNWIDVFFNRHWSLTREIRKSEQNTYSNKFCSHRLYSEACLGQTSAGLSNLPVLERCPPYGDLCNMTKIKLKHALFLWILLVTINNKIVEQTLAICGPQPYRCFKENHILAVVQCSIIRAPDNANSQYIELKSVPLGFSLTKLL